MTHIIEFIETDEVKGNGTEGEPWRRVRQLWTKDGVKVAEFDPFTQTSFYLPEGTNDLI